MKYTLLGILVILCWLIAKTEVWLEYEWVAAHCSDCGGWVIVKVNVPTQKVLRCKECALRHKIETRGHSLAAWFGENERTR
jgi:DNA-directed RNA polymerase subunit RPC12/RpoP